MRRAGIYIAALGAAIIVIYILYLVVKAIVSVTLTMKAGLILLIVGGILVLISIIRERVENAKSEKFKGITR